MSCKVSDAIISHGAYLEECVVENAIVGLRSRIGKGVTIRVTLLAALSQQHRWIVAATAVHRQL